jgi:Xaa-Pro aminopeptidase
MDLMKLKRELTKRGLDAVVAVSPENVFYATGAYILTQRTIRDRIAAAIFPQNGEPTFLICGIEESLVRAESWIKDIRNYVEFKDNPVKMLTDILRERGLHGKRVGIEKRFLCAEDFEVLISEDAKSTFMDCREVFEALRFYKEPREVALLQKGAQATRKAVEAAFLASKPGDTERQIIHRIVRNLLELGADEMTFALLGTGKRSSIIHPTPDDIPTEPGHIVRLDVGGLFKGYHSDLARVAAVGKPTPYQAQVYRKMMKAHKTVISSMKVGTKICDLFNQCKDIYLREGLQFFLPHIGHGLGIEIHEAPLITPFNETPLQENMVLNIEHIHLDQDGSGYHLEDLVLITSAGPEVLTGTDFGDEIPVIG